MTGIRSKPMATDWQSGTRWHACFSIAREEPKNRAKIGRIACQRVPDYRTSADTSSMSEMSTVSAQTAIEGKRNACNRERLNRKSVIARRDATAIAFPAGRAC
jgi:hypothetical protein